MTTSVFAVDTDAFAEVYRKLQRCLDFENVHFAAQCGANSFVPSMLSNLWTSKINCPYETPVYGEAWKRGLYSAASFWLLHRMGEILETHSPDMAKMAAKWVQNNPNSEWQLEKEPTREQAESDARKTLMEGK